MDANQIIAEWQALGERVRIEGHEIFVVDAPPTGNEVGPPLLALHGFPTSSVDFAAVLPTLREGRRVVTFDFLGYGLSDKPDRPYSLFEQADLVGAVAQHAGVDRVDLLTHDMGDSIGGEVLARSLDGTLGFDIARRVIANGSVYIDMAVFTDGQKMLLALPDEKLSEPLGLDVAGVAEGLRATLASDPPVLDAAGEQHLQAAAALVCRAEGVELLPRLIRYIEQRYEHEDRWTGAIERHPAPLTIVWGDQDPVAVLAMAERLRDAVAAARYVRLDGVGHFPMIEAPTRFADAVLGGLSGA